MVSNLDLQASHGFDPEWIVNRTGIHERRFALPHQATSDLCAQAAIRCLKAADCDPADVDLLVVGTFTPGHVLPLDGEPGAGPAQAELPRVRHPGRLRGVHVRPDHRRAVRRGGDERAGPGDRRRLQQPGDQPRRSEELSPVRRRRRRGPAGAGDAEQGLVAYQLGSDGSGGDLLSRPACGSRIPPTAEVLDQGLHYLTMDGRAVFKWAVRILTDSTLDVLAQADCRISDIRWFIPHQANVRIIHAASDVLGFHRDAVFKNLERYGNTSAGSIPIALDELCQRAHQAGRPAPDLRLRRRAELGDGPLALVKLAVLAHRDPGMAKPPPITTDRTVQRSPGGVERAGGRRGVVEDILIGYSVGHAVRLQGQAWGVPATEVDHRKGQ